ncbi:MAG: hypothetical protein GEU90_03235 [Gemmatimonas sp.]|nr:hypothetical protein [Gemmatimonas sp.]
MQTPADSQASDALLEQLSATLATTQSAVSWLAIFVTSLGVLFALGAIVAAFLLYRQSQDHQRRINAFLDDSRAALQGFMTQMEQQKDLVIEEIRREAVAAGESKEQIEARVRRIEAILHPPVGSIKLGSDYKPGTLRRALSLPDRPSSDEYLKAFGVALDRDAR